MDRLDTLRILSQAADWDAAAPSARIEQGVPPHACREDTKDQPAAVMPCPNPQVREEAAYGICRLKRLGGGSVPILKVLLSNACSYNCAYCVNRRSSNVHRASFQPEELARTIADFDARGVIQGAFISSGVLGTPDETMERLIWMARSLRERYGYRGYLHLKVIPGASPELVRLAMRYATRVSVNIELPSEESLLRIAPDKNPDAILTPMMTISDRLCELAEIKCQRVSSQSPKYGRQREASEIAASGPFSVMSAGQTTQLIVGASPEPDSVILGLAQHLYKSFNVRRVYYSAFRPEGTDPSLPHPATPPYMREFRLYQADMLFRWYGFEPQELFESCDSLDEDLDPKTSWALRNIAFFPVELMAADFTQLVRVPGIGPNSARKILELRRAGRLNSSSLRKLRIRLKYASWFITLRGKAPSENLQFSSEAPANCTLDHPEILHEFLREKKPAPPPINPELDFLS
jgi:putative DNA modification/repair radical SAM protein